MRTGCGDLGLHAPVQGRAPVAELAHPAGAVLNGQGLTGLVLKNELDAVASLVLLFQPDAVLVVDRGDYR